MTKLIPYACTLAVMVMAAILSLTAGAIGLHDFCGVVVAGGAVACWAIALQLARQCEQKL